MAECTRVGKEEHARRESYYRANGRERVWNDPFTYTYPYKVGLAMGGVGIGAITWHNIMQRTPWYYGFFARAAGVALMALGGFYFGKLREHHFSTREAVIDHYMELHPEDFERINDYYGRPYANVLLPWVPRRPEYRRFD